MQSSVKGYVKHETNSNIWSYRYLEPSKDGGGGGMRRVI